jgi:hypothetical protein
MYPRWWNSAVTVYNQYKDSLTKEVTWYRTVIPNCFFGTKSSNVRLGTTDLSSSQTTVRIPQQDTFLERYLWEQLTNDTRPNFFTLSPDDIIINGEVTDVIDEYSSGSKSTDILAKYKKQNGALKIQDVNINTAISGPHYHLSGV